MLRYSLPGEFCRVRQHIKRKERRSCQKLASKRLAPMKELNETTKRADARLKDGLALVTPVGPEALP
jgi:hypothetical protein